MGNIKKRIAIISLCCAFIACTVALIAGVGGKTAFATQVLPEQPINASYVLGDVFTPSNATISYKGAQYDATVVSVSFPDGKAYKTDSYVLSVPGEYKVNYTANAGGVTVHASVEFNVSGSAYEVSGSNSAASYVTIDNTDSLGNAIGTTTSGLKVSLAVGDKFTYKKPIDLNGKTKADKLVELYVLPKNIGKADARVLKVRLTDAYDPNNYVDIVTYGNYGDEDEVKGWALYSAAGATGQPLTGLHYKAPLENVPSAIYYLDGKYTVNHNIVYNSANGYPTYEFSLAARNGYGTGLYTMAMDYAEKRVYGAKPYSSLSNGIIVDLDEPLFFENLWQGFTTGEAYLSIWADNYVGATFDFIIQSIDGDSLENPRYDDIDNPMINVNIPSSGVPNAIVGEEYKLFGGNANDAVDGKLDLSVFVYKNYYSSNPTNVKIENGAFIPDKACLYTVAYQAIDSAGNVGIKLIDVTAKAQSGLTIDLQGETQQAVAGLVYTLKTPVIDGADGDYSIKVTVLRGQERTEILPDEDGVYKFLPMYSGEYTVEYACEDYNVRVTDGYQLTASANATPVIIDEVYLPPVFVNDKEYAFPKCFGYDFTDGTPVLKNADIHYAFDDGDFLRYTAGQKVKIEATEKVTVVYSVGDSTASKKTYVVPVTDVSGTRLNGSKTEFNVKNYLYGKDFTNYTVTGEEGVNYQTTEQNATLTFVNKLLVVDFTAIFTVKEYAAEKIVFTLTDSLNKNQVLTVELKAVDNGALSISVNGGKARSISISLIDNLLQLKYDTLKNELKLAGITFTLEDFGGFTSKKVYFDMSVVNNAGTTTVNFAEINGQAISDATNEYSKPNYHFVINSDQKAVGDKLIISEFIAQDVIGFETVLNLSVKDKEGNSLTATDNTVMNNVSDFSKVYEILLDKVGEYTVSYSATDGYNKVSQTLTIYVKDNIAPQITLKNPITSARVGANVAVANYTVTDATDKNVTVIVSVQRPDLRVVNVTNKSFKADMAGTYTVMYFVSDSTGNSAFAYYEVVVK